MNAPVNAEAGTVNVLPDGPPALAAVRSWAITMRDLIEQAEARAETNPAFHEWVAARPSYLEKQPTPRERLVRMWATEVVEPMPWPAAATPKWADSARVDLWATGEQHVNFYRTFERDGVSATVSAMIVVHTRGNPAEGIEFADIEHEPVHFENSESDCSVTTAEAARAIAYVTTRATALIGELLEPEPIAP